MPLTADEQTVIKSISLMYSQYYTLSDLVKDNIIYLNTDGHIEVIHVQFKKDFKNPTVPPALTLNVSTLTSLKILSVTNVSGDNVLIGSLPSSIEQLHLELCSMDSPPDLNMLHNLIYYYIGGVSFKTAYELPARLPSKLMHLSVLSSGLSGVIPINLPLSLQTIYLVNNPLSGTIPTSISNLTNLSRLSIIITKVEGSIPYLNKLKNLTFLQLPYNQLTGSIPKLNNLTHVTRIELSGNKLTGKIPSLEYNRELIDLFLQDNQLSGPLPSMKNLSGLKSLDLSNNQLSGSISNIKNLRYVENIHMQNNQFSGSIPNLDQLFNLGYVDLSNNFFSGKFPEKLPINRVRIGKLKQDGLFFDQRLPLGLEVIDVHNNEKLKGVLDLSKYPGLIYNVDGTGVKLLNVPVIEGYVYRDNNFIFFIIIALIVYMLFMKKK
jgi:Leucine-rich repeat (LRR) protein